MKRTAIGALGTALLDIIACSLAAAVVLAIIFSVIKQIPPSSLPDEFIIMEVNGSWSHDDNESKLVSDNTIGFEISAPNGNVYFIVPHDKSILAVKQQLVENNDAMEVSLHSARNVDDGRQRSYIILKQPRIGQWFITPYYYDYTQWSGASLVQRNSDHMLNNISIHVWTKEFSCTRKEEANAERFSQIGNDAISKKETRTRVVQVHPDGSKCYGLDKAT